MVCSDPAKSDKLEPGRAEFEVDPSLLGKLPFTPQNLLWDYHKLCPVGRPKVLSSQRDHTVLIPPSIQYHSNRTFNHARFYSKVCLNLEFESYHLVLLLRQKKSCGREDYLFQFGIYLPYMIQIWEML